MSAGDICGAIRTGDHQAEHPCVREPDHGGCHVDHDISEWVTPAWPYTSRPRSGQGIRVMRGECGDVLVAGEPYDPLDALELSARIARAVTETTTEGARRG